MLDEFDYEAKMARVAKNKVGVGNFCWACDAPSKKTTRSGDLWSKRAKTSDPPPKGLIHGDITFSGLKAIKKWCSKVPLIL